MFEHVVLLSFKGLMITWCEPLGGKSVLYAGWLSTSHRMAFHWFCTLWGWALSCNRMMSSVALPCLFLTMVSSICHQNTTGASNVINDNEYALGFLTTLNSKAER